MINWRFSGPEMCQMYGGFCFVKDLPYFKNKVFLEMKCEVKQDRFGFCNNNDKDKNKDSTARILVTTFL